MGSSAPPTSGVGVSRRSVKRRGSWDTRSLSRLSRRLFSIVWSVSFSSCSTIMASSSAFSARAFSACCLSICTDIRRLSASCSATITFSSHLLVSALLDSSPISASSATCRKRWFSSSSASHFPFTTDTRCRRPSMAALASPISRRAVCSFTLCSSSTCSASLMLSRRSRCSCAKATSSCFTRARSLSTISWIAFRSLSVLRRSRTSFSLS
mmetsp:Transcript_17852/g.50280  ORF Transcript_17852/g.50280 Transcript_17852/m.50280 type:complete len:211 (-) Transcript_17852:359-991(-)